MSAERIDVSLSSWVLPPDAPVRRVSTRDPALRHPDFDERFDSTTVFFDLYTTADPWIWEAACPPAMNLAWDHAWSVTAEPSGAAVNPERILRIMHDRVRFAVPEGTAALRIRIEGVDEVVLRPQPWRGEEFADARVVVTLSKDNDLVWIRDWAQFYVTVHGADSAVIYDNRSTRTSREGIAEALAGVAGLARFAVIDWPYKYGPNDHRRPQTLFLAESDFCQRGMFEHARCRLFPKAACVINADIDELIYASDGQRLCDAVAASDQAYVEGQGFWVEAVHDGVTDTQRHAAYAMEIDEEMPTVCEAKYAVDPRRMPEDVQWLAHKVAGANPGVESAKFAFGHFRAINTNWDMHITADLTHLRTDAPDKDVALRVNTGLRRAMDLAFPDRAAGWIASPPQPEQGAAVVARINALEHSFDPATQERIGGPLYWLHRSMRASREEGASAIAAAHALKGVSLARGPQLYFALAELVSRYKANDDPDGAAEVVESRRADVPEVYQPGCDAMLASCLSQSDPDRALAHIDAAIAAAPGRPAYHVLRAAILRRNGAAAAVPALRDALAASDAPDLMRREMAFLGTQVSHCGRITPVDFLGLEVHRRQTILNRLHLAYAHLKEDEGQLEIARAIAAHQPLSVDNQALLAETLIAQGLPEEAREAKERALEIARMQVTRGAHFNALPKDRNFQAGLSYLALARALLLNERVDEAADAAERILDLAIPEPVLLQRAVAFFRRYGVPDRAHRLLDGALRLLPGDADLLGQRLAMLVNSAELDAALAMARRLAAAGGAAWRQQMRLAWALDDAGRHGESAEVCGMFISDTSDRIPAHPLTKAANLARKAGRLDIALTAANRLVADYPDSVTSFITRAGVHTATGNTAAAREDLEHALAIEPDNAEARRILRAATQSAS